MPAPLSYEEVCIYIKEHNECKLLTKKEDYKNSTSNIEIECKCGRHFITTFNRFKYASTQPKQQCDVCSGHHYDLKKVKELAKEHNCIFLDKEYMNRSKKYHFQCSCGNIFERSLNMFLRGQDKCNQCSIGRENFLLTENEVKNVVESYGLEMLSPYIDATTKIKLKCTCGGIFEVSYNKMVSRGKVRCNRCTKSKSNIEILAELYLRTNNIKFSAQHTFKDLKTTNNTCLRFDLALFENEKLVCLIELDGQQHYKLHKIFTPTKEILEWTQERDKIKDCYCKENNIRLYRIPYWNFNHINEELEKILKQENLVPSSKS